MGMKRVIPILPEAGSEFDFLLYTEWLRVCDGCHKHTESYVAKLPTRVIDVEHHDDSDCVRLRVTNGQAQGMYIALSHRWQGDIPTTTRGNIEDRRTAIKLADLSPTFRDAVCVTRKLGVRFLWIDSLCIIQDNCRDWEQESKLMEEVFASAYCTIAASSTKDGFLNSSGKQSARQGNISPRAYASEVRESFEQDVENGNLSRRGWILQERALSCRTIHFTGEQTYWECGSAIWSKTVNEGMRCVSLVSYIIPFARTDSKVGQSRKHVLTSLVQTVKTLEHSRKFCIPEVGFAWRSEGRTHCDSIRICQILETRPYREDG